MYLEVIKGVTGRVEDLKEQLEAGSVEEVVHERVESSEEVVRNGVVLE